MADTPNKAEIARRQKLREQHPDAWIAVEPGDELIGKVVDVTEAWSGVRGDNGSFYPLLTVEQDDGSDMKLHCFGAVLYNEILRLEPRIGDEISVIYLGQVAPKTRGHNPTELYRVRASGKNVDVAGRAYGRIRKQDPKVGTSVPPDAAGADPAEEAPLPF